MSQVPHKTLLAPLGIPTPIHLSVNKTNRNHSQNHDQIMTQLIRSAKGREELINIGVGSGLD